MKTTKIIIGIISIVLFLIITFQSCAAGIGNALEGNDENSGSIGFFVGICMLIAGIVGIATKSSKTGGFVSGGFYAVGGILGITSYGSYSDLQIWSALSLIFAAVFIIGSIFSGRKKKKDSEPDTTEQS